MAEGTIKKLTDKGFGFIEAGTGKDMFFHSSRVDSEPPSGDDSLTILVDPGSASSDEISELLLELSTLYRMLGGSGVAFTVTYVKEPVVA